VVVYIDRQLAGPYGRDKYRHTKPPFVESVPEHGYQGERNPREIYCDGIGGLGNFADLSAARARPARSKPRRGLRGRRLLRHRAYPPRVKAPQSRGPAHGRFYPISVWNRGNKL
jgi:gluconate 2-dehydrogenase gamma chain